VQFPDFRSVNGRGRRPTQPFPVLARMRQAGPGPFPQDLPFELGKNSQQACHGATRRSGQVQCLGQGHEADAQMLQFPSSPNSTLCFPRWVAYFSDESGRQEVYLAAFPEPRERFQISVNGGAFPVFGAGGRELFFLAQRDRLMAVSLKLGAQSFEHSAPRELFQMQVADSDTKNYDAAPDGQRFLVRTPAPAASGSAQLNLIVNWPSLLKKEVVVQ
jgi:hypothetical protein